MFIYSRNDRPTKCRAHSGLGIQSRNRSLLAQTPHPCGNAGRGQTRGHKGDTRGHKGTHDMSEASMLWRIRVGSVGFGKLFFEWIIKKNLFIYF